MEESKSFESLPIRTRLTDDRSGALCRAALPLPGVEIKARLFRNYPYGELASHVIGYIGRINQAEKEPRSRTPTTRPTTAAPSTSASWAWSRASRRSCTAPPGWSGGNLGRRACRAQAGQHPATPGNTVVLSIDIKLQKLVEDMYGERRGALVALDPRNRRGAGLCEQAHLRPQPVCRRHRPENWQMLNESIDKPCSTARCAAPTRRARPTSPSWRWRRCRPASARPVGHQRPGSGCLAATVLAQPRRPASGAGGHAPRHREVEQRVLLLAGQ
jgi:penicillin-binding protein 2